MSTFEEEREQNFAAYDLLKSEILAKHLGQYVAIADGRLIKSASTFDEAQEAVQHYKHHLVFKAGTEPDKDPVYIRPTLSIKSHD